MKTRKREALALTVSLLVLALVLSFLTRLMTPKQHDFGSTWGHYLSEEEDSLDLIFFGSSLVYCDVVPAVLWEETGLTGYVLAGPEQTIPMTYYYVREALTPSPPGPSSWKSPACSTTAIPTTPRPTSARCPGV